MGRDTEVVHEDSYVSQEVSRDTEAVYVDSYESGVRRWARAQVLFLKTATHIHQNTYQDN